MTRTDAHGWVVIAHHGGPRDFWRTIATGKPEDEDRLLSIYKDTAQGNPSCGGVRLLKEGSVVRYAGAIGKPGEDAT